MRITHETCRIEAPENLCPALGLVPSREATEPRAHGTAAGRRARSPHFDGLSAIAG